MIKRPSVKISEKLYGRILGLFNSLNAWIQIAVLILDLPQRRILE